MCALTALGGSPYSRISAFRLANAQQQQQTLFDKQARLSRFASKAERDAWLNNEIRELTGTVESLRQQVYLQHLVSRVSTRNANIVNVGFANRASKTGHRAAARKAGF